MLLNIILATVGVGLLGIIGAYGMIRLLVKGHASLMFLVSFAAGAMVAVSFFDLLPEAIGANDSGLITIMEFFVLGFIIFLLIEKAHLYYHCHEENCQVHKSNLKLIIIGDAVHNFLDGVAIAASFLAGAYVGIFTTLAIIIHEIPKEVGDIGVLIHGGYSRAKALFFNAAAALAAILGGVAAYYALDKFAVYIPHILALTAGGFIYIAAVDLLPELHHDSDTKTKVTIHSFVFILGIALLWLIGKYMGE